MKIVVTGAAGFIGSNIIKGLNARGIDNIIAVDELSQGDKFLNLARVKIADYVDPPRVVPLIGPVQLHHAHYKCTVYYSETIKVGWPIPHTTRDEDAVEVIYIDHNHFHMVGNVDTGSATNY